MHTHNVSGKTFQLERAVTSPEGGGSLSALAVSDCGTFVATGSMSDGIVEIFIAFSLQVWDIAIFVPLG